MQTRLFFPGFCELVLAIPLLASAGVAHAQCSSSDSPQPTAGQTVDYSNQTFSLTSPYNIDNAGENGCDGASRGDDTNGDPGSPGQPAGTVNNSATNVTVAGPNAIFGSGAVVGSTGGNGGNGGSAGSPVFDDLLGGNGGAGGAGGALTVNFLGVIGPDSDNRFALVGLQVDSEGGSGGNGGGVGTCCGGDKNGGDGGSGGAAAMAQFTGSGQVQANQGIVVQSLGGNGGAGASVSTSDALVTNYGGNGGDGGQAGAAAFTWQSGSIQASSQGGVAASYGGNGGDGGSAKSGDQNYGGNGGVGGGAGNASVTMSGGSITFNEATYSPYNAALLAVSEGGAGGAGGSGGALISVTAGSGGAGGSGGAASASMVGTISYTGQGTAPGHAIYVGSAGGLGGAGGNSSALEGSSGGGGLAGAGGSASLTVGTTDQSGVVTGNGTYAHTAVVQSIGGGGGSGGVGSFLVDGGAGAPGGDGGTVSANIVNGSLVANGASASGLIVQSVGGGGGIGGNSNGVAIGADLSIGGNGGLGGDGNGVTVQIEENAIVGSLDQFGDNGVLAQSIGGSGGAGGTAIAQGSGLITLTIGGDAGGGGQAGQVQIGNAGLITSYGDHAAGLQAQSIGGGGGKGGSAVSFEVGVVPTASVAIGGRGGSGGPADSATVTNSGQVTTYGSDAYGIVAQSVGGGGGSGGAATARAVDLSPNESFPAISVSVALGGAGGSGNTGAAATASNSGIVTTAGEGAYALVAQSVGGGGGIGGDSTAASYASGSTGLTVSLAVAIGGAGGTGATGGSASTSNSGLLLTYGADAYGVFAQSVGGGGGAGGSGDSSATADKAQASFAASLAVGGKGGTGGTGGTVNAGSTGGIATNGDGADGVFAQSVGGGGGTAGGGTAAANGGTLTLSVGLGGSGGAGGDGGAVTASNDGAVVTRGTDAVGLLAQSIGGGGGKAGKGGATSGGVSPVTNDTKLFNTLAAGLNLGGEVTTPINGILKIGKLATSVYSTATELYAIAQQLAGNPGSIGGATSIDIGVSIGGKGGAAGKGGDLSVGNSGEISTFGAQSDGVFAQSVGGGGGKGGAASSTDTSTDDSRVQTAIGLGGGGGAGGDGGNVSVVNEAGASVQTQGVLGFGVVAQSVGGGGGSAGLAGTVSGSLVSLSVGIGGSGGSYGTGGEVKVTNDGAVITSGKHGIGIFAQSTGGGGGLARTMTTNETFDPSDIINNPQGRVADVHGLTLSFNGSSNTSGDAGTTEVDVAGSVATSGRTAHAILAQSIGGGGGAAIGGQVTAGQSNGGTGNGDGSTVTVSTTAGATISTAGDGAYGILAQSIGGGGGLGGDPGSVSKMQLLAGGTSAIAAGTGAGGQVTIGLTGTNLTTTGKLAPAIYAQSLGGGGGLIAQAGTLFSGAAGGSGSGASVSVALVNSNILASGDQSSAIVIQTNGTGSAAISLDAQSSVVGGATSTTGAIPVAAIHIQQGSGNSITNAGKIAASGSLNLTAVLSDAAVQITNTGTITGAIVTAGNGSTLANGVGGVLDPGATIALGAGGRMVNAGTLHLGGVRTIGSTTVTGNLSGPGRIVFDADFVQGVSDKLIVNGSAEIAGVIEVNPSTMRNARLALVSASGGVTLDPALAATQSANQLFTYRFTSDGTTLYAAPQAQFEQASSGLGEARAAVGIHLQALFDSGESFDTGFTALANLASHADYANTLESLTGQALGATAAWRYQASRRFVSDVNSACETARETNCTWARVQGGRTRQSDTTDSLGYDARYQIFEIGAQIRISDDLYLGGALAYENSDLRDTDRTARTRGNSILGAIALHYRTDRLEIVGTVDGGYGWYSSNRQITVGSDIAQASANPQLWNLGAAVAASYRIPLGADSYLKPFAEVRGTHVHTKATSEKSASVFALEMLATSDFAISSLIGSELGATIKLGEGKRLKPFVSAAAVFADDTDWKTSARFVGESGGESGGETGTADPFSVHTRSPGTFGRFGIGAELTSGSNFAFTLSYNPEFGSGYTTHQGVARLTYRF